LTYEYRLNGDRLLLEAVDERSASGEVPPRVDMTRERLTLRRVE
jgi:hypothetical protein